MIKIKPAQSILEYAILIAIVIAAVVVMQVYMKRGISGRLKESSDKISGGQSFSASNTTTYEHSGLVSAAKPRQITEMTGINGTGVATLSTSVVQDLGGQDIGVKNIAADDAYSASTSTGGDTNSVSKMATDDASKEAFKANDLQSTSVDTTDFKSGQ